MSNRYQIPSGWNLPPGVYESDEHFNLPSAGDDQPKCPACEEVKELCRHCGLCKEHCQSDESQRDFDSDLSTVSGEKDG